MKRSIWLTGLLALGLAGFLAIPPLAHAQKAAERFIPLGQSPGLSGTQTLIGRIETVDPVNKRITLAEDGQAGPARITQTTRIWLDRSLLRLPNTSGGLADLVPGRRAEIKFADAEQQVAEWVKVELDAP